MRYEIVGNTLYINSAIPVDHANKFKKLLRRYRIKQVTPRVNLSYPYIFLIKKYTKTNVEGWPENMVHAFNSINVEPCQALEQNRQALLKRNWAKRFFSIFSFTDNTWLQTKFWFEIFIQSMYVCITQNIMVLFILFFGAGLAISFLLYAEFLKYSIQIESCKVAIYSASRILVPILSGLVITAKTCTAFTSIINKMYSCGEVKVLDLMNLPYNRTFLHPLLFAIICSGPLLNMIALYGVLLGICFTWIIHGWSWTLFISLLKLDSTRNHVLDSLFRSLCGSIVYGVATCLAGLRGASSFEGITQSINICVNISALGIIAVNTVISILTVS